MNKKVLIVHGGKLNKGQLELVQNNYNIKPIKEFNEVMDNLKNYDYIIFDEAQRLRRAQIDKLFKKMSKSDCKFIISLDGNQTLGPKESKANAESILDFIKNNDGLTYSLKDKFRSNPEMSEFIKLLMKFSVNSELKKSSNKHNNITIKYFSDKNQAQKYLERMENNGLWTVLNYTRSLHTIESLDRMVDCGRVTHEIIGQEFDNVIIPMDTNFTYKQRNHGGKEFKYLTTTRSYYDLQKMLYQNLTRTKTKLQIVVISNYELFGELCSLLDKL